MRGEVDGGRGLGMREGVGMTVLGRGWGNGGSGGWRFWSGVRAEGSGGGLAIAVGLWVIFGVVVEVVVVMVGGSFRQGKGGDFDGGVLGRGWGRGCGGYGVVMVVVGIMMVGEEREIRMRKKKK